MKKEDDIDPAVGIEVAVSIGDAVDVGQPLFWICHNDRGVEAAEAHLTASVALVEGQVEPPSLIIDRIE